MRGGGGLKPKQINGHLNNILTYFQGWPSPNIFIYYSDPERFLGANQSIKRTRYFHPDSCFLINFQWLNNFQWLELILLAFYELFSTVSFEISAFKWAT